MRKGKGGGTASLTDSDDLAHRNTVAFVPLGQEGERWGSSGCEVPDSRQALSPLP